MISGTSLFERAIAIIAQSNREHPADQVLRDHLRAASGLSRSAGREISQMVFAYYRWLGWLNPTGSPGENLRQACALDREFRQDPHRLEARELVSRTVPAWVSQEMEVSPEWAACLQKPPRLWIRARPGQGPALAQQLGSCRIPEGLGHPEILEYLGDEDLFRRPEFQEGHFEIQDLASQWVGFLCQPKPGQTWWDACAGEGGKTLHLSDLMQNKGLIWASDRSKARLQVLKRRTARARVFNYRLAHWHGGANLPTKTKFDGVLIDAPCAGLGTWRRNPHARWTTSLEDVRELSRLQQRLLHHAAPALKPGGILVYAVCSMTRSETVEAADDFEKNHPDFLPCPSADPFDPRKAPSARLCLWPQDHGGNGMFVALWRKN